MATLGTQLISTSYTQLLKTYGTNIVDGTLRAISSGDEAGVSALQISTTGVNSTGSFSVAGASTFTGSVTLSSSFTASTGTATIGTASIGVQNVTTSTVATSTIGTLTVTSETSTNSTVTSTATVGTLRVGAAGPRLTAVSYGTAAFTLSTVQAHNVPDTTTGTFALTGCALGDIIFGSIDTLGAATGTICLGVSFYPQTTNVARYSIINKGGTAGTISAGTIYATAMRFTT
jgi:hypothetical protein